MLALPDRSVWICTLDINFADIKKTGCVNKTQPVFYFVLLLET